MLEKLEKLRAKPDHIKQMVAYGVSGAITAVIFLFWVVSLSVSGGSSNSSLADTSSAGIATSPVSALTASVEDAFTPVASAFSSLMGLFSGGDSSASSSNAIEMYAPSSSTESQFQTQ